MLVINRIPQESVVRYILFQIFIGGLEDIIKYLLTNLEDYTKLGSRASFLSGRLDDLLRSFLISIIQ